MRAEILAVGTELLLGDIVNTNAQFLARRLSDLGIEVYHQSVVGDNETRLYEALQHAFTRAELVIATGGLGPTKDDLTKEVSATFFQKKLSIDETALHRIEEYFLKRGINVNEGNRKQAYVPESSIVLQNDHGTAPGIILENNGKTLILLPGPPMEMKPMFENSVAPYLAERSSCIIASRILRIFGIGEGHMAELIDDIITAQSNPTVAPYAKEGEVTLRITAKAESSEEAAQMISKMEGKLHTRLAEYIYGTGETSLEEVVGELLVSRGLTIATAESCTGGLLAGHLINYAGISSAFLDGVVCYSNESKVSRLGVKKETLERYGAVSCETAAEMAQGAANTAGARIGISTTGIAGPSGGSEEKPVGMVFLGLYFDGIVKTKQLQLSGSRSKIRGQAVREALNLIRKEILCQNA